MNLLRRVRRKPQPPDPLEWESLAEFAARARRGIGPVADVVAALASMEVATAEELARKVGARTQVVRRTLADDSRFVRVDPSVHGRSPRAKLYRLSDVPTDGSDPSAGLTPNTEQSSPEGMWDGFALAALLADTAALQETIEHLLAFDATAFVIGRDPWPGDEAGA